MVWSGVTLRGNKTKKIEKRKLDQNVAAFSYWDVSAEVVAPKLTMKTISVGDLVHRGGRAGALLQA